MKVELTEKEIKELGSSRYARTIWKTKLGTFILGLGSLLLGLSYYEESIYAKIYVCVASIVWLGIFLYWWKKENKAGATFLKDIKNSEG